ncbi:MAG: CaiB/BaiF CoA transferase family protein, partial [Ferrimicrobium acidiphilum]
NMTGPADGPPTLPSFGLADSICALASSTAVMMALRAREQLGVGGQIIDMNILEPIMMAMGPAPSVYHHTGIIQGRNGNRSVNNAPRNTYQTRDGKWVAVSASAYRIACRVMELVGHPELIDQDWFADGRGRVAHVDEIDAYLGDWIGHRDREEVIRAFEEAQAAIAPIYDARDIVDDPQVRATEMLVEVPDEDLGSVMMHNVMWKMSKTPGRIAFTGRAIGQDTRDILIGELGVSESEFELLREDGAVG